MDNKPIQPNDHYKIIINEDRRTHTLVIVNVTIDDDAEYTVRARNTAGEASQTAELLVTPAGKRLSSVNGTTVKPA